MNNSPGRALSSRDPIDKPAGRPIPDHPDALLYPAEVAFLLGLSVRTLEAKRLKGGGIPFIALGRRAVRYRRSDLLEYIEAHRRRSTSDPGGDRIVPAAGP